jgi:hypothetical protein
MPEQLYFLLRKPQTSTPEREIPPTFVRVSQTIENSQSFYMSCIFKGLFKHTSQLLNKFNHPNLQRKELSHRGLV